MNLQIVICRVDNKVEIIHFLLYNRSQIRQKLMEVTTMKIKCKKEYKMDYSFLDKDLKLKVNECFNLAQNTATEYFEKFNGDNIYVREKDNAVWVVTKSKIHIYKNISWLDILTGESYTSMVKPIRVETETKFTDSNNELVFIASQQSCPLDIDTRKIRKIDTLTFPKDMEIDNSLFKNDYQKLNDIFNKTNFVYEQKVYSQDIDYSNHVNNTVYARYIMNSLSNEFLDRINITDVEIHYIAESKEGQILKIYKKEKENSIEFLIKEREREIIRASISYKNK